MHRVGTVSKVPASHAPAAASPSEVPRRMRPFQTMGQPSYSPGNRHAAPRRMRPVEKACYDDEQAVGVAWITSGTSPSPFRWRETRFAGGGGSAPRAGVMDGDATHRPG